MDPRLNLLITAQDRSQRALRSAQRNMSRTRQSAMGLSGGLNSVRRGALGGIAALSPFAIGVGGAAVALSGAVGQARQFSRGIAEVRTILPEGGREFDNLEDQVRGFADQVGRSSEDVVPALYQAISAGVSPDNVFSFLEVANQAAIGGVTDLETAVDGLTTSTNAFGAQGLTTTEAADAMFTAVRLGKTTFEELSRSIGQVAPIAAASGVSFEEVNAQIAQLTTRGFATSEAATAVRAAIQGLLKPSDDLALIWDRAGFSGAQAAIESEGLAGAMNIVAEATGGNIGRLQTLVGSIEGVNAILGVTGDNADSFTEKLQAMEESAGAAGEAFATVAESDAQRLEESLNRLSNASERIGAALLPALAQTAEGIAAVTSGERGIIEQSLDDGLLGWILRVGDETRFRTVPTIQEELIPAVNSATETDDKWAATLRQLNMLQAEKTNATALATETLKLNTEATLLHNEAARVAAEAIAVVTMETYSLEEAMGIADIGIREVNEALRAQEERANAAKRAFIEYQAAVTRTLEGRRGLREAQEFLENTPQPSGRSPTPRALTGTGPLSDPTAGPTPQPVTLVVQGESLDGVVYQGSQEYAQVNGL